MSDCKHKGTHEYNILLLRFAGGVEHAAKLTLKFGTLQVVYTKARELFLYDVYGTHRNNGGGTARFKIGWRPKIRATPTDVVLHTRGEFRICRYVGQRACGIYARLQAHLQSN